MDALKREAARAALQLVEPGMRLGLGTGSTAKHFVDLLGERVATGFDCLCVPTSEVTAAQARSLNIPLSSLEELSELDMTVDGADEIDPDLGLIKGGGGALLREKIVAGASKRMIVIADETKLVEKLGRFPLPIEVNRFGLGATRREVDEVVRRFTSDPAGRLTMRSDSAGNEFVTDGGHLILDASFGLISDANALSAALLDIAGVVQHGLFLNMCETAFVATQSGIVVKQR
ncbi:MAG: ribose-5-phosphate isomerase RpiA [Hyphomicrobiaceae bacterium]|nr:ribose-5-phosphate isomerase RpiA [Hyphomicrobiaceae bacterium]